MPDRSRIAVIAGSGFACDGSPAAEPPETRFGFASAPLIEQQIGRHSVPFQLRHGLEHTLPPHRVNYRANMQALRDAGMQVVIAVNTVGVISVDTIRTSLAVPDQILDYTWGRAHTIYDDPQPDFEHIEFTHPLHEGLRKALVAAAKAAGVACHEGGTYAATQGPRLETVAEVIRMERDGADYIGMTGMPEAALAAELGLRYAMLSLLVNPAAGKGDKPIHDDVKASTEKARSDCVALLESYLGAADEY